MLIVPNGIVNAKFKGKRLLVTKPELKEIKVKGVIRPGQLIDPNAQQTSYESYVLGEVIAIGDTVDEVAVGDTILYHLADVRGMGGGFDAQEYVILTPGAVIAIVDQKQNQLPIDFSKRED